MPALVPACGSRHTIVRDDLPVLGRSSSDGPPARDSHACCQARSAPQWSTRPTLADERNRWDGTSVRFQSSWSQEYRGLPNLPQRCAFATLQHLTRHILRGCCPDSTPSRYRRVNTFVLLALEDR